MEDREALSQLRYLEQELAGVFGRTTGRFAEPAIRDELQHIAEQHARQAGELGQALARMGVREPETQAAFRRHVEAVEREVVHARDEDGLLTGLADAERLDVRLRETLLAEALPADVRDVVETQTAEVRDHLDFLESRAPGLSPSIRGVEAVPKEKRPVV